jgi:glutamyl-tRNA synthetase
MHIGNIRTALLNYLFAKQKTGTFVLRIEDTDPQRNFDPGAKIIISDLDWLSLSYDEGPGKDGPYAPYFQSERSALYQTGLDRLKVKKLAYPCFCTEEELEKKRDRQRALKIPPRYDRACLNLSDEAITDRLAEHLPHIWRFKFDHDQTITITDLSRGTVTFELKNFSDFPLTRTDGSFTFMFANFVDDMSMKISHVFRGEDHLSNTANQAALYLAFDAPIPIFWHMPMLCNLDGKKLSKRDFGFSLHDLQKEGFLPQAIDNYLAIIGGSYAQEIMNLDELSHAFNFENPHTTGAIKYDVEKLRWVNHKWIDRLTPEELITAAKPFLIEAYPQAASLDNAKLSTMVQIIKTDLHTIKDTIPALQFFFEAPTLTAMAIEACVPKETMPKLKELITKHLGSLENTDAFLQAVKAEVKEQGITIKQLFWFLRLALMGQVNGPGIHDLIAILGVDESKKRIERALAIL